MAEPRPSFGGDTEVDPESDRPTVHDHRFASHDFVDGRAATVALGAIPPRGDLSLGFDSGSDVNDEALAMVGRISSLGPPGEPPPSPDPMAELRERYALGDFSGALAIAETLLRSQPTNSDLQRYADSCREVLHQMYGARLGSLHQVPVVAVPTEQLRWLTLDHRAGFLLSHVDGSSTLEEILDISGMPRIEAMRVIYELLQQRVIVLQ
jgi:hypothetical protein